MKNLVEHGRRIECDIHANEERCISYERTVTNLECLVCGVRTEAWGIIDYLIFEHSHRHEEYDSDPSPESECARAEYLMGEREFNLDEAEED